MAWGKARLRREVRSEAERLLADRTHFVFEGERREHFVELLDRPPQDHPGLREFFSKPSAFDAT